MNLAIGVILVIAIVIIIYTNKIKNQDTDDKIESINNVIPGAIIQIYCSPEFELIYANDGFFNLLGYTREEVKKNFDNKLKNMVNNDQISSILNSFTYNKGEDYAKKLMLVKKDKSLIAVDIRASLLRYENGMPIYNCVFIENTDLKESQHNLKMQKDYCKSILELSDNIIFEWSFKEKKVIAHRNLKKKLGVVLDFRNYRETSKELCHKDDLPALNETIKSIIAGVPDNEVQVRLKNIKGKYIWYKIVTKTIFDNNNIPERLIGNVIDIDKQTRETLRLKEQSERDPLTKLYNKVVVERKVTNYLITDGENKLSAMMIIDIDDFKSVNDKLGHYFGDAVITQISDKLIKLFFDIDLVGRIGGDEFIVFLKNVASEEVVLENAKDILKIFNKSYAGENNDYKISGSIGISMYPKDGKNYAELFKCADKALYVAKNRGKDRFEVYDEEIELKEYVKNKKSSLEKYSGINLMRDDKTYENIVIKIFEILFDTKDIHVAIDVILNMIGRHYNINHVYIYELAEEYNTLNMTYEYYDDAIYSKDEKKVYVENLKGMLDMFDSDNIFYCNDVNRVEVGPINNNNTYTKGTKSLLQCIITEDGEFKGIVGFDDCTQNRKWVKREIDSIIFISKILTVYLIRLRTKQKLLTQYELSKAIIRGQSLWAYIIDKHSYEVLYYNMIGKDVTSHINYGDKCYQYAIGGCRTEKCDNCPILGLSLSNEINTVETYDEKNGRWISSTATTVKWNDGREVYLICCSDVTKYMESLSNKDKLTSLPNMHQFRMDSEKIFKESPDKEFALIYTDIAKFKYINDKYGYVEGDNALKTIANIIKKSINKGEIAARVGGDNFLLLVEYENMAILLERLQKAREDLAIFQEKHGRSYKIGIKIGIVITKYTGEDISIIIDKANIACKSIKRTHNTYFSIFNEDMHKKMIKEREIEDIMEEAVDNKEFKVYYQPKFDIEERKVIGAEALVRWINPERGMIYPDEFIPLFEKNGFIVELDMYVFEEVCKKFREWINEGKELLPVSVNFSANHFTQYGFAKSLKTIVDKYNIPNNMLELEITERAFANNLQEFSTIMKELKEYGFVLSMDDFGTDYSSLTTLKELPFDVIKLDKSFFTKEDTTSKDKILISNVVHMAKELNLRVVSEGVETSEQADFLKSIGCHTAQGYLYAKPMPVEQYEERLT